MSFFVGDSLPYLEIVLSFIIVVYVLHTYLDLRQFQCLMRTALPSSLKDVFDDEHFSSARSYSIDKWVFNMIHGVVDVLQTLAILHFKVLPMVWSWIREMVRILPRGFWRNEVFCTVLFVGLLALCSTLLELPWGFYKIFVIEQKHGFNKQTIGLFVKDTITSMVLGVVLMPPFVAGLTMILMRADAWLPLYLWLFTLCLALFAMTIYPTFIAPLFNKFSPLTKDSLKTKIDELAGRLKFPLKRVYTMDGSKRSGHSNAYMYGLFNNKRIVLFDTLIADCSENEVTAVLAHELGHWKMSHNVYNFVSLQLILLLQFVLFTFVRDSKDLFESFGFEEDKPVFISLVLFSFISTPFNEIVDFVHNMVSRRFEFQADNFAVRLGMGSDLRKALIKLESSNKSSLNVDPWYSTYHFSHPPLVERLQAIDKNVGKTM